MHCPLLFDKGTHKSIACQRRCSGQEGKREVNTYLHSTLRFVSQWPSILYSIWSVGWSWHGCLPAHKATEEGELKKIIRGPDGSKMERDFTFIDGIVTGASAQTTKVTPSTMKRRSLMSPTWATRTLLPRTTLQIA